jgi:hypothetical protein
MKCPECEKLGFKSCVYPNGCSVTAMCSNNYYDENGKYHVHNMNTRTTHYTCSNGHSWVEDTTGSCWCGWPENEK